MSAEQQQIAGLIATGIDGRMYATEPDKLRRLVHFELARESRLAQPALRQAGVGLIALGDHIRAQQVLARALECAATPRQEIAALINLGDAHRYPGDLAEAGPKYEQAIQLAKDSCPDLLHFAMQHYGKHLIDARKPRAAVEILEEVLKTRWRLGDAALITATKEALSLARAAVGQRTI